MLECAYHTVGNIILTFKEQNIVLHEMCNCVHKHTAYTFGREELTSMFSPFLYSVAYLLAFNLDTLVFLSVVYSQSALVYSETYSTKSRI